MKAKRWVKIWVVVIAAVTCLAPPVFADYYEYMNSQALAASGYSFFNISDTSGNVLSIGGYGNTVADAVANPYSWMMVSGSGALAAWIAQNPQFFGGSPTVYTWGMADFDRSPKQVQVSGSSYPFSVGQSMRVESVDYSLGYPACYITNFTGPIAAGLSGPPAPSWAADYAHIQPAFVQSLEDQFLSASVLSSGEVDSIVNEFVTWHNGTPTQDLLYDQVTIGGELYNLYFRVSDPAEASSLDYGGFMELNNGNIYFKWGTGGELEPLGGGGVPEPSSMAVIGLALGFLGLIKRSRRAKK